MRIVVGITTLLALLSGCYDVHSPPGDRDGGPDAPRADAPFDAPPRVDAPPNCRASCEESVSLRRFEADDLGPASAQLLVRDGTSFVLFGVGTGVGSPRYRYVLFRLDSLDGRLLGRSEIPIFPPPESNLLLGALLSGPGEALELTWAEVPTTTGIGRRASIRRQRLDASGRPASAVQELGVLERSFRSGSRPVSVFGRERAEGVAMFERGAVGVTPIGGDATGEEVMLAHVDGAPVVGPIEGVSLPDGRWAVAYGGAEPRMDPRQAFLVYQRRDGSVETEPIVGELEDAAADLVASGDGFGLFRLISNPRVLDPRVRAEVRDGDGRIIDAITLSPASRFAPGDLAAFELDGAPAVAWVERDRTLRILPPASSGDAGSWAACTGVETTHLLPFDVRLPTSESGLDLSLASTGDGSGDVLVLAWIAGAYELFRVPGCRLDRVD